MEQWKKIVTLLNPVGESHASEGTSDGEIYQAVMGSIAASENIKINGSDNSDVDDPIIEPHPTWREVLRAVSTISRYTDGSNDPIARQFETFLSSFNRLLCLEENKSMKETVLTDFFQRL